MLLTLPEAADRLRRKPRRLKEFLRANPLGLDGRPLYLQDGRDKLFSEADIARISDLIRYLTEQGLPCRSNSGRRVQARRHTTRSGGHTSASILKRALELAGETSRTNSGAARKPTLKLVGSPHRES